MAEAGAPPEPSAAEPIHSDLDLLLAASGTVEADRPDDPPWTLQSAPLGALTLAGDRVVVGDPFVGGLSLPPLARRLPPGPHPVSLTVARISEDHLRVAALVMRIGTEPVVRWAPACWEDGSPAALPVDAGTLCIGCAERAPALDTETHGEALLAAFDHTALGCRHPAAPDAVVVASSGWGDGIYGAWWGLDEDGRPAALVLDTEVLVVPVWETVAVPLPLPWRWSTAGLALFDRAGVRLRRGLLQRGLVIGAGLRRLPRLRLGPAGGPRRTVQFETVAGVSRWRLGAWEEGDELELGLIVGHRAARPVPAP
jgi:hypothetical protein